MGGRVLTDDLALVERRTPQTYRLTALGALAVAVIAALTEVTPVVAIVALGVAVYSIVQVGRKTTSVVLRVDRAGVHSEDGLRDATWAGAALIWVGRTAASYPGSALLIYTRAGIDFTRRARTRLRPTTVIRLPVDWSTTDVCTRLRQLTDVPVLDGTVVRRRTAELQLMGAT